MNRLRNGKILRLASAAIALSICTSAILLNAQTNPKKPPAKPAAPAKGASVPAKPAGASAAKPGAPTTNHPTTNSPTANRPGAPLANGQRTTGSERPGTNTAGGPGGARAGGPGAARPGGSSPGHTATGHIAPAGSRTVATRNGAVTRRADGRISDVHDTRRGMDIHHGMDGSRRVSVRRPDGSRLVAERGRRGFVERPYHYHGHDFARRSYYNHGVRYDRYYNHYYYRGVYVDVYAPPVYFAPGFYGWAYNPWSAPIAYSAWGWGGAPWFAFYGAYFTPWSTYPSAAFWLADYMLAADLQAVYAAQAGGAIQIPAAQPWTDSGVQLVAGQTYTVAASGLINYGGGNPAYTVTPAGSIGPGCMPGQVHTNHLSENLPCYALIGKVGSDGVPFAVGRGTTFVAPASGELLFGVNDCVNCFGDNSGTWSATVTSAGGSDVNASARAAPSGFAMPPTLKICEQGGCGTMTWDGARYSGTFNNGAVAVISVVSWDANSIVLTRNDPAGVSAGNTATYTGRIVNSNEIAGTVTGVYNGRQWVETWQATSATPVLAPAAALAATADAQPASLAGATPLTPEVKQAIADEVRNQLALENAEAAQVIAGQDVDAGSSGIARIIQDVGNGHAHIFVVGDSLDVTNASTQQECHLSEGDAVQMVAAPAVDATAADVVVKSSKGGVECTANVTVAVNLTDLQEMQNHMREQIDAGLKDMRSKAGTGGIPQPPDSAKAPPSEPQYAAIAPPPSPQDQSDLEAQNKEATAAETEAQQGGGTPSASNSAPSATPAGKAIAVPPAID